MIVPTCSSACWCIGATLCGSMYTKLIVRFWPNTGRSVRPGDSLIGWSASTSRSTDR